MIYFTADPHISHKNLVRGCSDWENKDRCREFATVTDHDNYVVDKLKKPKSDDELYILGDLVFGPDKLAKLKYLREQIKCKNVHLIEGNHDFWMRKHYDEIRPMFTTVSTQHCAKIAGRMTFSFHYCLRTFPFQSDLGIHLYGHSHGSLQDDPNTLSMDVGLDTCLFGHERFTPYSVEEIHHIMDTYKVYLPVDHHGS